MSEQDTMEFFRKLTGQEPEPKRTSEVADESEPYSLPQLRPETYIAFRLGKRRERLLIGRATQPLRFPAYHELRDISFDQAHQQGFVLYFEAMTFTVIGKNLWPVVHAISNGRCDAIYEYHAALYPSLPATGEPWIESITLEPPVALTDEEAGSTAVDPERLQ